MAYVVSLKQFEGPLDLLLHLINQAKVDIHDIFISEITEQYLESIGNLDELDMDAASEFLQMAALLLEIKSRSLLPKPPEPVDDEESPEQMLIRRLEEYRLYKESAERMRQFEKAALTAFSKLPEEFPLPPQQYELTGLSIDGLLRALARIMERTSRENEPGGRVFRSIHRDRYSIDDCIHTLRYRIKKGPVLFSDVLSLDVTRDEIVSYFLAVLELLKLGIVHVEQESLFDDILIVPGDIRSND